MFKKKKIKIPMSIVTGCMGRDINGNYGGNVTGYITYDSKAPVSNQDSIAEHTWLTHEELYSKIKYYKKQYLNDTLQLILTKETLRALLKYQSEFIDNIKLNEEVIDDLPWWFADVRVYIGKYNKFQVISKEVYL